MKRLHVNYLLNSIAFGVKKGNILREKTSEFGESFSPFVTYSIGISNDFTLEILLK